MGNLSNFLTNYGLNRSVGVDQAALEDQQNYAKQVHALGIQRQQAENELIPESQAAARAKLGLSAAQDTANTGLVAPKAKLEGTQVSGQQQLAEGSNANIPMFLSTKTNELQTANATTKQAAAEAGVQMEHLPEVLDNLRLANKIDDQKKGLMWAGGLRYAMANGDEAALDYVNSTIKKNPIPGHPGATAAYITPEATVTDQKGNEVKVTQLMDAQHNVLQNIPHDVMHAGFNMLTPPVFKEIAKGGKLAAVSPVTGQEISSITNYPDKWVGAPSGSEVALDQSTGEQKPLIGQGPGGQNRVQQTHMDHRVQQALTQIEKYSGIEAFKGLDPNDQPKFDAMTTRAGELVRGGVDPEKAVHQAIDETVKKYNIQKATGGTTTPGRDFRSLYLKNPAP